MLSVKDVEEVLGLTTIGVIPESGDVLNASNKGEPVILDMESAAGQAYDDAVARLMGEERPMRFTQLEKKGFFSKIRSEEHTSELQSLMRISYAVFCVKKKKQ